MNSIALTLYHLAANLSLAPRSDADYLTLYGPLENLLKYKVYVRKKIENLCFKPKIEKGFHPGVYT